MASPHVEIFRRVLAALRPTERAAAGLDGDDLVCIGASLEEKDMFVIRFTGGESKIVWTTGEVIDEWDDFRDFFLSMLEYSRQELQHFLEARRNE